MEENQSGCSFEIGESIPERNLEFVVKNTTYARKLARQFYRDRKHFEIDIEDFEGAALLGLCDAARRYDPEKGMAFQTYAYFRIRGAMYDQMRRGGGIPRRFFHQLVKGEQLDTNEEDEKEPSEENKDDKNQLPYAFAKNFAELASLAAIVSEVGVRLHQNSERETFELSYCEQSSPEDAIIANNTMSYLQKLVSQLPENQRRVLEYRYFQGLTIEQMREKFVDVSRSWVSRLHAKAIESLRMVSEQANEDCVTRIEEYAS